MSVNRARRRHLRPVVDPRVALQERIAVLERRQEVRREHVRWYLRASQALIEREDLRIANLKAQLEQANADSLSARRRRVVAERMAELEAGGS
ncbi:hypothetical protein ACRU44_04490 [Mycobacterium colombiense]